MSRYRVVTAGTGWSLGIWHCEQPEPGAHPPERTTDHQIVFPTRGVYARRIDGVRELLDATRVVYFNAGQWYEVDHPTGGGDRCTVLSLDPALVEALASDTTGFEDRPGFGPHFASTSRITHGPLHLAQQLLLKRALPGGADPVALDEATFALIRASLPRAGFACESPAVAARRHHRRAVDRALELIHAEFSSPLTLSEIARAAAYSPYHLSRIFRASVGMTLHRYLNKLRLREALAELADGTASIGRIALRYGFSSHSHFTEAFRREFGTTPRALRA